MDTDTLRRRGRQQRRATEARNQAIIDAQGEGMSLRAIAAAVGLSHSAVNKIVKAQR